MLKFVKCRKSLNIQPASNASNYTTTHRRFYFTEARRRNTHYNSKRKRALTRLIARPVIINNRKQKRRSATTPIITLPSPSKTTHLRALLLQLNILLIFSADFASLGVSIALTKNFAHEQSVSSSPRAARTVDSSWQVSAWRRGWLGVVRSSGGLSTRASRCLFLATGRFRASRKCSQAFLSLIGRGGRSPQVLCVR